MTSSLIQRSNLLSRSVSVKVLADQQSAFAGIANINLPGFALLILYLAANDTTILVRQKTALGAIW